MLTHVHAFVTLLNVMKFEHALLKAQVIAVKHYISLITIWCELSDGKVQFSSVQRGISLNLELNSRFSLGHFAEPQTGPTVQVWFWFEPIQTFGAWEKYF